MCGNWYFPLFLFNEGSLIQMNMASLMFLALPCGFPVNYSETVWTDWMPCSVVMLVNGGWGPEVLLYPVP